jgi:hypothetical protein
LNIKEWVKSFAGPQSNKLINLLLNLNMLLKRFLTFALPAACWAAAGWFIFWPTAHWFTGLWPF